MAVAVITRARDHEGEIGDFELDPAFVQQLPDMMRRGEGSALLIAIDGSVRDLMAAGDTCLKGITSYCRGDRRALPI